MGYYVYILYSKKLDSFYKGQTNDVGKRLHRHNSGYEAYTKKGIPWILIWSKEVETRSKSMELEKKLKNMNHTKLKNLA
jgi:putative endonuclease